MQNDVRANPLLRITRLHEVLDLTDELFEAGSTRPLAGNRPILYGSNQIDFLEGTRSRTGTDITDHRQLEDFANNGIVYVAGPGDDTVIGTAQSDILIGGTGRRDVLRGGAGNDLYRYRAGDGHDVIEDSDGLGSIEINGVTLTGEGATLTTRNGKPAWQTLIGGQELFIVLQAGSLDTGATLIIASASFRRPEKSLLVTVALLLTSMPTTRRSWSSMTMSTSLSYRSRK